MDMKDQQVLGLFAKWPTPGRVKSRLAAETTPEWAAQVADSFLRDIVDRCCRLDVHRVLAYSPPDSKAEFEEMLGGRFELMPQHDGDLGTRLAVFVSHWFQRGTRSVVLIGMDSPTLPLPSLRQAFESLEDVDVVIGPATDGGYYLIGFNQFAPALFEGIAWSTESVLVETVEKVHELKLRLSMLPPWYDVDTLADWRMLRGHMAGLRLAGEDMDCPRTENIVEKENC